MRLDQSPWSSQEFKSTLTRQSYTDKQPNEKEQHLELWATDEKKRSSYVTTMAAIFTGLTELVKLGLGNYSSTKLSQMLFAYVQTPNPNSNVTPIHAKIARKLQRTFEISGRLYSSLNRLTEQQINEIMQVMKIPGDSILIAHGITQQDSWYYHAIQIEIKLAENNTVEVKIYNSQFSDFPEGDHTKDETVRGYRVTPNSGNTFEDVLKEALYLLQTLSLETQSKFYEQIDNHMGGDAARIQSLTQHQSQKGNSCALQSLLKAIQECGVLTMVEYL